MLSRVRSRWGDGTVTGGRADRDLIARQAFGDPEELAWLETQIHPLVREELAAWISGLDPDTEFAVAEVPLLFEGEMADRFDLTVAIVTGDGIRKQRAMDRGQVGLEGREARQLGQDEKAGRADFVVTNDGTPGDLEARLADLLDTLRDRGSSGP